MRRVLVVFAATFALVISGALTANAVERTCYVCGTGGGGVELLASFDGDDAGERCVELTGNGWGFYTCDDVYTNGKRTCEPWGDTPNCRTNMELSSETGIDGYLRGAPLSRAALVAVQDMGGTVRRSCDGAVVARALSDAEAATVVQQTQSISL